MAEAEEALGWICLAVFGGKSERAQEQKVNLNAALFNHVVTLVLSKVHAVVNRLDDVGRCAAASIEACSWQL